MFAAALKIEKMSASLEALGLTEGLGPRGTGSDLVRAVGGGGVLVLPGGGGVLVSPAGGGGVLVAALVDSVAGAGGVFAGFVGSRVSVLADVAWVPSVLLSLIVLRRDHVRSGVIRQTLQPISFEPIERHGGLAKCFIDTLDLRITRFSASTVGPGIKNPRGKLVVM